MLEVVMIMWVAYRGVNIQVAYFADMELCNAAKITMVRSMSKVTYGEFDIACFPTGKK